MMNCKWVRVGIVAWAGALSLSSASCSDGKPAPWAMRPITRDYTFPARNDDGTINASPKPVAAADLNKGRQMYVHYCYACHGMNGDGHGPSSYGLRPPPRDFRLGVFKFAAVRSGEKPNDLDFVRIVRGGLHGTAMLKWDISNDELWYVIQFIKTFPQPPCDPFSAGDAACQEKLSRYPDSSDGKSAWEEAFKAGKKAGQLKPTGEAVVRQRVDDKGDLVAEPLKPELKDPWGGKDAEAVKKGEQLYHLKAQCVNCHPSFMTRQDYFQAQLALDPNAKPSFRGDFYRAIVLTADKNPYGVNLMPPDFTLNPLRSIRDGSELMDLYRLIASGVGGVMPQWVDALTTEEIWALAHYVRSLQVLAQPENRDKRNALEDKLEHQPKFAPAPPKEETPPVPKEETPPPRD